MPTLLSIAEFRERFDISADILDKRIVPHLGSASRRLRKWVGDEAYQNAFNGTTVYADMAEELKNAEAHLTYHFAVEGFNYPMTSKGIVANSQSGEGKESRRYLTPEQTAKVKSQMLEAAREIAEPYCYSRDDLDIGIVSYE